MQPGVVWAADDRKKVFTSAAQFGELRPIAKLGIEADCRGVSAQRGIPSGAGKAGFQLDGRGRRGPECRLRRDCCYFAAAIASIAELGTKPP